MAVLTQRLAVHAHHAEVSSWLAGNAAETEQRHRHRDLGALGKLDDLAPACDGMMPWPARMTGRFASWISATAFL